MIESLDNVLAYIGISEQYFIINAGNNTLVLTYDTGTAKNVVVSDGTYLGTSLATALKAAIDAALTCTSTVTWDSTTRKFTLAVPAGHTLTYTHTGSSMGLLIGFNQNHAAAVSIISDQAVGDPTAIIASIHIGVEAWVKKWCRNPIESTTYSEFYDGDGGQYLFLRNLPIVAIERVSIGRIDVISIRNTYKNSTANASVTSSGIVLVKDGVSDATVTFASNTTIGAVVTAINALGNGWAAQIQSSDYSSFQSTLLVPVYGLPCVWEQTSYFSMPDYVGATFEVYANEGFLFRNGGWPVGRNNVFVKYTAGYASADIGEDLKLGIKELVKWTYKSKQEELYGIKSYTLGDVSVSLEDGLAAGSLPGGVMGKLWPYRKILV